MVDFTALTKEISTRGFEAAALETFAFQAVHCPVYARFIAHLGVNPASVTHLHQIPFLPVESFKYHQIVAAGESAVLTFGSSGTTGQERSFHYISRPDWYENSYLNGFKRFFGDPAQYTFLALLPSYLERPDSSLVYMVQGLMNAAGGNESGFFPEINEGFLQVLRHAVQRSSPLILFGVSFALLDLCEMIDFPLEGVTVIETGGMKGRGRELTRAELAGKLKEKLGVRRLCSEYGMTELLSQAYCEEDGKYQCPPWMKILIRETQDPLNFCDAGKTGGVNVIDLANRYSCSFLATKDLGKRFEDESFEILGRFDDSDLRGCNLLYV